MSILQVGSTVNNYKITKILGEGQFGTSYLGQRDSYDPSTGQPITKVYVIKTINLNKVAEVGLDPQTIQAEAQVLKELSGNPICDQYITCYYDYFTQTFTKDNASVQYLIIISDYIKGETLQQIILKQSKKGHFELGVLLQMMFQLAQAVDYIHTRGVAHQNIKPSNIIYDSSLKRLRLMDFTFSCSVNLNAKCKGKAGTIYYMPPELIELPEDPSKKPFSFRATHDIWSLGVVFFQMANLGQDYIKFTSKDPAIVAKEIQTNPVQPSTYPYIPINSVIATMLNKDYTQRPTSGQVVIELRLARPLCIINNKPYDRQMAEALVTSFDIDVDPDINDYKLCTVLTDYLEICKLNNNAYQKEHLLKLADMLGLEVKKSTSSATLCKLIQGLLKNERNQYSDYVTQELLRAQNYRAYIEERLKGDPNNQELKQILEQLVNRYKAMYDEAKKLELLNLKMLEYRRKDATLKSLVYKQNASIAYAKVYSNLANYITLMIVDINPNAKVGGIPIIEFQQRMTV